MLLTRRCCTRLASSTSRRPSAPPPTPSSAAPSPPPLKRPRYPSLASLGPAAHRLAFRSLPYASPPSVLFPPSSEPRHVHHSPPSKFFTARCFPSPRYPNAVPRPLRPDSRKLLPTPPPTLVAATSPSGALLTPEEHHTQLVRSKYRKKPWTLDLTLFVSKKKVHKSAVVRERVKRRVREAVRLVVVRGARAGEIEEGEEANKGQEGVRLRERKDGGAWETGPGRWLVPGFHYIFNIASLEAYRAPLPELVEEVRTTLKALKRKAEAATLTHQLSQITVSPDPPPSAPPLSSSSSSPPSSPPKGPSLSSHAPDNPVLRPTSSELTADELQRIKELERAEDGECQVERVEREKQVSWEGTAV
ncbi:hypothetical protein JCM8547_009122 [Rhodosporidiobolus lusitaniae]